MAEKTILQDFLEKRPDIKDPARIVDRFCPEQAGYDPVYNIVNLQKAQAL